MLYPSELATGMRIYVEYNKNDPNLVRVQHRNAGLAIIPAGSIAVIGWLAATVALVGLALLDKRLDPRTAPVGVETEPSTSLAAELSVRPGHDRSTGQGGAWNGRSTTRISLWEAVDDYRLAGRSANPWAALRGAVVEGLGGQHGK